MTDTGIKKIALAYSGGLDTSIIIPWLKENYPGTEVIAVCTNVGQEEDWEGMEQKAITSGASKFYVLDLQEEFITECLYPILRAGAIYEGKYLLGTSAARPLQAKRIAEIAVQEGCDAVAHGCTGKGNDQVRFELIFKAVVPHLKVIAPWRVWNINSREAAIEYAEKNNIPIGDISKKNIYSRDGNLWHLSHEGGDLEDPWNRPKEEMFQRSVSPAAAPDKETEIVIDFEKGIPTGLGGKKTGPMEMIDALNTLGSANGIGRSDIVETRVVGMKSRGVYETPAGTILLAAMQELEMLTLDADSLSLKRTLAQKYSELVYAGKWFTPVMASLEAFMEKISEYTTGQVRLVLYKGNIIPVGRKSPYSLYLEDLASFGESSYNQADATGFINLFGLSTGVTAMVHKKITDESGQVPEIRGTAAKCHDK